MEASKLTTIKSKLLGKKVSLEETIESLKQHALKDLSYETTGDQSRIPLHPADHASDVSEQDTDLNLAKVETAELDQVIIALNKIEDGQFGQCEACGQDISLRRLEALPFARYCIRCSESKEAEAKKLHA